MYCAPWIVAMLKAMIKAIVLIEAIMCVQGVSFGVKTVTGSTCIHGLLSQDPFIFDQGHLAQMMHSTAAVHITKRSVRFISFGQKIRSDFFMDTEQQSTSPLLVASMLKLPCSLQALETQTNNVNMSALTNNMATGSLCTLQPQHETGQQSQILPCSQGFAPRIHPISSSIMPVPYSTFLKSTPMCKHSPSTFKSRQITLLEPVYDITQCDLHDGNVHILFLPRQGVLYLSNSMEVDTAMYWIFGVVVVVLVACLSQSIVALLQQETHANNNPRGEICLIACAVAWGITLGTTEISTTTHQNQQQNQKQEGGSMLFFITVEEQIAYWIMIAYGGIRLLVIVTESIRKTFFHWHSGQSVWRNIYSNVELVLQDAGYYNFIVICLVLLSSRVHATMETPYILGLLFLFGVRLFLKILSPFSSSSTASFSILASMVLLGDGILLSVLLQAGVVPQFGRQADADACILVFLFACINVAQGIVLFKRYQKELHERQQAVSKTEKKGL